MQSQDSRTICTQELMSVDGDELEEKEEEEEEKEEEKIYITEHLTLIEQLVFQAMVREKVTKFELYYRFSNYDKELYIVKLIHTPDNRVYIRVKNEACQIESLQSYFEYREGNIFDHHNWGCGNKYYIQEQLNKQ